jgi:hypothetical protein
MGIDPDGSGTAPSHTDAQADAPRVSAPQQSQEPASPRHATRQSAPAPSAPADEPTQGFPSRRARREAQARQQAQGSPSAHSEQPTRRSRRDRSAASAGPTFQSSDGRFAGAGDAAGAASAAAAGAAAIPSRTPAPVVAGSAAAGTRSSSGHGSDSEPVAARSRSRANTRSHERTRDRGRTHAAASEGAEDSAPRHSRREGDAFPSIVRWTTLGTLLPGLGMIHGRSKAGWVLLLGFLAGILAILAWIVWRSPVKAVARVAGSPTILYAIAVVLLVGILIWAFTILRSYSVLKRGKRLTDAQKWLGWGLVVSLMLCVGIPLGVGAAYTKVQGDTVIQVFGRDG